MKNTLKKIATVFCTVLALGMISCQQEVEHVHTFSDTWSFDENSHWHEATCGHVDEVDSLAYHEFSDWDEGKRICVTCGYEENCTHSFTDWRTVTDPTEEDDGLKERNCLSCGYKETDLIFALGHHHNIKSEWSSDETSHWHAYDCGRPEHFEDKAAHIEDSGTVTKEPTCTEKGSMVYKCTVCKKVLRTEDIATKEHSYGGWVSTDSSKHWKECAECGKKIEESAHSYGDWVITDGKHWKECECGKKIEAAHSYGNWTITDGKHWKECNECGKKIEESVHSYGDWKVTDGNHWKECGVCGKKMEESVHSYGNWTITDSKHWKECECGKKIEESTHSYGDWKVTDGNHWKECECGRKIESVHSYGDWKTSDSKHWKVCECGKKSEESDHEFIYKGNGWKRCKDCDKNSTTPVALNILGYYDSTKMTFGVYPQTIKARDVTVDKTVKNREITGADYYLGSDGAWYAECVENVYKTGYKYSDGSTVAERDSNSVKYFKVEPIEWVYLSETKCLLAKNILTANDFDKNIYYDSSSIRRWLNETFYNSAFTGTQKSMIKTTDVDNSAVSTTDAENKQEQSERVCKDTQDNIFLLSAREVTTTGNGFTAYNVYGAGNSRIKFPTDYALANSCSKDSDSSYGGSWWLRSPIYYDSYRYVRIVQSNGSARKNDGQVSGNTYIGVVPALSLFRY